MIAETQQNSGDPEGARRDTDFRAPVFDSPDFSSPGFSASGPHLTDPDADGLERAAQGSGVGSGALDGAARGTNPLGGNGFGGNALGGSTIREGALSVGLVDCYRFSQEALVKAFEGMHSRLAVTPFTTVTDCIAGAPADLDVVVYYAHAGGASLGGASDAAVAADLAVLRQGLKGIPLVVMSDAEDAKQPDTIRNALKSGARGFIPTRTMGIPLTLAVLRFVQAGGTYAPLDRLLDEPAEAAPAVAEATPTDRFTARQITVLMHLKQGKANKTIAHELGMSESTVKVHVRNIMRTMGATNRTQAAYKAQQMWRGLGQTPTCDQ